MSESSLRPILGSYMNITCFQYLRLGTEEVAGRAPIVSAGRQRGYDVIESLGLLGKTVDASSIQDMLASTLGVKGTRLCVVQRITAKPNGGYEVQITESACTAGQTASEPVCAFTLGVFVGAIQALTGKRMRGHETACSACGNDHCVYQIDPVE